MHSVETDNSRLVTANGHLHGITADDEKQMISSPNQFRVDDMSILWGATTPAALPHHVCTRTCCSRRGSPRPPLYSCQPRGWHGRGGSREGSRWFEIPAGIAFLKEVQMTIEKVCGAGIITVGCNITNYFTPTGVTLDSVTIMADPDGHTVCLPIFEERVCPPELAS